MRKFSQFTLIVFFVAFLQVGIAKAQAPTPTPEHGYTFEKFDYEEETRMSDNLNFGPEFFGLMGSTTVTQFSVLDAHNVLPTFIILLLAIWVLWVIFKFTTTSTPTGNVDINMPIGKNDTQQPNNPNPYKRRR